MADNSDPPPGGYTLQEAFERFTDPEKIKALREAEKRRAGCNPGDFGSASRAVAEVEKAEKEARSDFRERCERGEIVAYAREESPAAALRQIPPEAWRYLYRAPGTWTDTTLQYGNGGILYAVKFYTAAQVSLWEKLNAGVGLTLREWGELADPVDYRVAHENARITSRVLLGESDADARRRWRESGKLATERLRSRLLSELRSGAYELRTVKDGAVDWTPLSLEVAAELVNDLEFGGFRDGECWLEPAKKWIPVRVFLPAVARPVIATAETKPTVGDRRRDGHAPLKNVVADDFAKLPPEVRQRFLNGKGKHGATDEAVRALSRLNPDEKPESLRRALTAARKDGLIRSHSSD